MKQRWHRHYGRLGRRYETRTPGGPSVDEDYDSWDGDYRQLLFERTDAQGGPRDVLANRRIPTYNFRPPSEQADQADQETSPKDKVLDVDVFLKRLSKPWPPVDREESPSDTTPGTSESVVVERDETRPRYTAAEKGKQRAGEPPSSSGPSAIKPAVPNDSQSTAPAMSTAGLRVPPRRHSPGDGNDEDGPSIEHVEDAASEYLAKIRSMVMSKRAVSKLPAGNRIVEARVERGFAAELPLDGQGVVWDRTRLPTRPFQRSKHPSPAAMERTRSQMGIPGPSSQPGSVQMERTESQARIPDPNSQEYARVVAESNRRLEELSPYSPEDKIPDTPMPDLEAEPGVEQPPPLSRLPPSQPGGDMPQPGNLEPYHAPILRAKRNASEISGGGNPGPSSHRQPPAPAATSMTAATMSMNGQERRISWSELRAMGLQPPPTVQQELYRLYSVLVQVMELAPSECSVVDPHDFIEVLSWSDVVGAGDAQVIQRLHDQTAAPNSVRRKLLIPFCLDADVFLALADLSATTFTILDQRTDEDLRTREKDDGFETSTFVWEFMHTLFPDECPVMPAWTILFQRTVQGPVPINEDGILSGRYVDEFGRKLELQSILPFFLEALQMLCGVKMQTMVADVALLKRLFTLFEGSTRPKTTNFIKLLRERSQEFLRNSLEGQINGMLEQDDIDYRKKLASTRLKYRGRMDAPTPSECGIMLIRPRLQRPDGTGRCSPTELLYLRFDCKYRAHEGVMLSLKAANELIAQHGQLAMLLERMATRCTIAKARLHHAVAYRKATGWFDRINERSRREVWHPQAALNQYRTQGLKALADRV